MNDLAEGYKPQVDWGGGSGDAALILGSQQVRLVAWRKKLLYSLMAILLIMAVTNFMATLWVLSRISFNTEGLGSLHVEVGGVQLWGRSWLGDTTTTPAIRSRPNSNLSLTGYHKTSVYSLGDDGQPLASIILDSKDAHVAANSFEVTDNDGLRVFHADTHGTDTAADNLRVTGRHGAVLGSSAQTPLLLAKAKQPLGLESSTRGVHMFGGRVMSVEARDGDISAICQDSLTMSTEKGNIRLVTRSVYLPDLPLYGEDHVTPPVHDSDQEEVPSTTPMTETQIERPSMARRPPSTTPVPPTPYTKEQVDVYQVCVCPSGRIFLAPATTICVHDPVTCR